MGRVGLNRYEAGGRGDVPQYLQRIDDALMARLERGPRPGEVKGGRPFIIGDAIYILTARGRWTTGPKRPRWLQFFGNHRRVTQHSTHWQFDFRTANDWQFKDRVEPLVIMGLISRDDARKAVALLRRTVGKEADRAELAELKGKLKGHGYGTRKLKGKKRSLSSF